MFFIILRDILNMSFPINILAQRSKYWNSIPLSIRRSLTIQNFRSILNNYYLTLEQLTCGMAAGLKSVVKLAVHIDFSIKHLFL